MASAPLGPDPGGRQIGHFPGAEPAGGGARKETVRSRGVTDCGEAHPRRLVSPVATGQPGRSTLDVADTAENEQAFGRPGASRGSSAYPKIRFVGLPESGTHVLWAACMGKYKSDEITLAAAVVPALRKGMLCLADRFFPAYDLWRQAAHTGADLLWRARKNARLEVDQRLADGSSLSRIYRSTSDRRKGRQALVVRVIEYRLQDVPGAEPIYRLITTVLDPKLAPAKEQAGPVSRAVGNRNGPG